jgi:LPS-assembly protein
LKGGAALRPVAAAVLALWVGAAAAQESEPLQLRATPKLAEDLDKKAEPPSFIYGDSVTGRTQLETVIEGHAELRRPGLTLRADKIVHDQTTDIATATGDVQVNSQGNRYTATKGQLQVDAFEGFFLQPTYRFLVNGAYGSGERIEFYDPDRSTLFHANYTTCGRDDPAIPPGWLLAAERLDIDREEDEGRVKGATLRFLGLPAVPLPSMSFPLSESRRSGWLPPTIGLDNKSGLDLSVPYYWNIAPNRDATFTPQVMLRRGVNVTGEFRYLESDYRGQVEASVMPGDRLRNRNRWALFLRHNGTLDTGWDAIGKLGLNLNLNRVSDNDYWSDFPRHGLSLVTRLLANDVALSWARGDFAISAHTLKWQTLQDVNAPIVPPYDRMPQLSARWTKVNDRGFDYALEADYTRFQGDRALTLQPNAQRSLLRGQLAYPFVRPWGFVTPKVQMHATHYLFDGAIASGATSVSRTLPTLSLDSGLVFERDASYFGRAFRQTLEPRLMYVYTPYRDQNTLPNYDSGLYDFNFATIWAENAFAGDDRVVDNNLITAGLTTRLLDPESGVEAVRLAFAQRYRFTGQKVVLPGGVPTRPGWSDIMLGASISWDPRWALDTVLQYNPDTRLSTRTTIQARWSPEAYHTVSVAYRHQRDLSSESIDIGWQWPLADLLGRKASGAARRPASGGSCAGSGWYSMGRMNYSMSDRKVVDAIVGFEYDAGCWIGRIVYDQLQNSTLTTTAATRRIMFQIELVGLSRVGSSLMGTLRNNVPRYQDLRQNVTPPSRFTAYD